MKVLLLWFIFLLMNVNLYSQEVESDTIHHQEIEEMIFVNPERMPRFPGCEDMQLSDKELKKCSERMMLEFVYSELKYPKQASKKNKKGIVVVGFTVTESGNVENIRLLRDIGGGCGKEAVRVIQEMAKLESKWIPGTQYGRLVPVNFNLPIKFDPDFFN